VTKPTRSELEELERILSLDPEDPRRHQSLRSVRMRNLLRLYEQFADGANAPQTDVADALTRLSTPRQNPVRRAPKRWPRVALAMAALLLVAVGLRSGIHLVRQEPSQVRSGAPEGGFRAEAAWGAENRLDLSWPEVDGATKYELVLFDTSLAERARVDLPLDERASVDFAAFSLPQNLAFEVVASGPSGELDRTRLQPLPKP